ncbi:MAG: hypothetical protein E6507_02435 [Prevotella bivia]|uniref:Uncharacterized protein n=1 Tax=Prevotella bivia TaxID=28125 RepID=A0A137SSI6_9BACT|nr:hypothetical protein [Prevotella bivia]KGF22166.1 hypothetical protein HMPREF1651_05805 [Prevotella bivia DNF00188]KGF37648.1 hypothetical protein HMPREF2136_05950 [Prevotella bivia DNF00650]KXO15393.1 hypothetical protein HMPREF3202_01809 [Prevotella bivia]KXU55917.1 hypothetical protein HMPREF3218_0202259 [Prevotella bivia]MDK7762441.1 hypothetical protein [Prevotella bivia]
MGFFSKLFNKNEEGSQGVGGMEDYMTLVRVYFQASLASHLGITNLAMLPDLRTYKQTFHIPTVNNKLGVGEKASVSKTMKNIYQLDENFFSEIDKSIKKNCKKIQDIQTYLIQFQGYTQELMMLIGNLMKFKLRVPGFFKKVIYSMTAKTVNDIFEKNDYSDPGVIKSVLAVRQYNKRLGFSQKWTTDFIHQIVLLAKKEPKAAEENKPK